MVDERAGEQHPKRTGQAANVRQQSTKNRARPPLVA